MNRVWIATAVAAAAACITGNEPGSQARLTLSPLLDTVFVGDTAPPLTVTFVSAAGDTQAAGPVTWQSDRPAVATVDAGGRVAGVSRGETIIMATAGGVTGRALLIVSNTLQATLLLDTIYLMIGDTFTVPVLVQQKGGGAPAPWFEIDNQVVVDIDSASGLLTANANGGYFRFIAHADTVADTGFVQVVNAQDTTVALSRAHFTVLGTVIRHLNAQARALDYRLRLPSRALRVTLTVLAGSQPIENVVFTVPDSFAGPATFFVDSISLEEATGEGGTDFICRPARSWALWGSGAFNPPINALSRRGGQLTITQVDTVPGGLVVSGRFRFDAQRMDFYNDPGGLLPVRGTFVAPLVTNINTC